MLAAKRALVLRTRKQSPHVASNSGVVAYKGRAFATDPKSGAGGDSEGAPSGAPKREIPSQSSSRASYSERYTGRAIPTSTSFNTSYDRRFDRQDSGERSQGGNRDNSQGGYRGGFNRDSNQGGNRDRGSQGGYRQEGRAFRPRRQDNEQGAEQSVYRTPLGSYGSGVPKTYGSNQGRDVQGGYRQGGGYGQGERPHYRPRPQGEAPARAEGAPKKSSDDDIDAEPLDQADVPDVEDGVAKPVGRRNIHESKMIKKKFAKQKAERAEFRQRKSPGGSRIHGNKAEMPENADAEEGVNYSMNLRLGSDIREQEQNTRESRNTFGKRMTAGELDTLANHFVGQVPAYEAYDEDYDMDQYALDKNATMSGWDVIHEPVPEDERLLRAQEYAVEDREDEDEYRDAIYNGEDHDGFIRDTYYTMWAGMSKIVEQGMLTKRQRTLKEAALERSKLKWKIYNAKTRDAKIKKRNANREKKEAIRQAEIKDRKENRANWVHIPELKMWLRKEQMLVPQIRTALATIIDNPTWPNDYKKKMLEGIIADLEWLKDVPEEDVIHAKRVFSFDKAGTDPRDTEHLKPDLLPTYADRVAQANRYIEDDAVLEMHVAPRIKELRTIKAYGQAGAK